MLQETVKLLVPFEALIDALAGFNRKEKHRLWELLAAQLSQAEEEGEEQVPESQAELREAHVAYLAGDTVVRQGLRAVYHSGTLRCT